MYSDYIEKSHEKLVNLYTEHVFGPATINYAENEVIVLCLLKNGEQFIKEFIEHYFKLGVRHIVFLDNGSTDGTIEAAKKYERITILKTEIPFGNRNNMRMRDYLINRFAKNRWSLCVDIDEFFDFPFSDIINLNKLIRYLNNNNYTALAAQMLDLFGENIVRGRKKAFYRKEHKYYTLEGLTKRDYCFENGKKVESLIKIYSGGVRSGLFGLDSVFLTKHPLIFNNAATKRGKFGHLLKSGSPANFSAVLLHYKFTDDFFESVEEAAKKEQYFNNSFEYKKYFNALKYRKSLILKRSASVALKGTKELLENGFLVASDEFKKFVRRGGRRPDCSHLDKQDVTVVIGVKDRGGSRLENAFLSLRNQDYDKSLVKIILVDYGSRNIFSEEFKNLCDKYEAEYIKIDGVDVWSRACALNIGIKKAGTKYVLCSDADIIFEKNYIKECVAELQKNSRQVIWRDALDLAEHDLNENTDVLANYQKLKEKSILRCELKNSDYTFGLGIIMAPKKYFFDIRGYDEFYKGWGYEDDDIIKRFLMLGLKTQNIRNKTSYLHQWHKTSKENKQRALINKRHFENAKGFLRNPVCWGKICCKKE